MSNFWNKILSKIPDNDRLDIIALKVCGDVKTLNKVVSKSRKQELVRLRYEIVMEAKDEFGDDFNASEVARFLNRTHATILHYLDEDYQPPVVPRKR